MFSVHPQEEGVFINADDGHSRPGYLPWAEGDPNGNTVENGIAINIARFTLVAPVIPSMFNLQINTLMYTWSILLAFSM